MRTRTLALGLAALAVAAWLSWPTAADPLPPSIDASTPDGTETSDFAPAASDLQATRLTATPSTADAPLLPTTSSAANHASPLRLSPWLARFVVIDERDEPVGDAVVTITAASRTLSANPANSHLLRELRTDGTGRVQTTFEHPQVFAQASKDSVGRSVERFLLHTDAAARETKLRIEPLLRLQGTVLRADGHPASSATVRASVNLNGHRTNREGVVSTPEPATSDTDGRFTMMVQRQASYILEARLDDLNSFSEVVWVADRSLDVALTFPGGVTLGGVVVGPDGQPVEDALVRAWREVRDGTPDQPRDGQELTENAGARTRADGRFSMPVRTHARYQLIASRKGHAHSQPEWVETTAERPHADARLRLQTLTTIRGHVERGDGTPFADAMVSATAETGGPLRRAEAPAADDMFPPVLVVTTGRDGSFELSVHPGTTWTVCVRPVAAKGRVSKEARGVQPGSENVVLRLDDDDLEGCIVHGSVRTLDGQPTGAYEVRLVTWEGDVRRWRQDARAAIEGDRFRLPALPLGRKYSLCVRGPGSRSAFAPAEVGPFTTDQPELRFDFVLQPWAEVAVRVLDASRAPVQRAMVQLEPAVNPGITYSALETDADGRVALQRRIPGANTLLVSHGPTKLHEQPLFVTPGINPEVVVQLPAMK